MCFWRWKFCVPAGIWLVSGGATCVTGNTMLWGAQRGLTERAPDDQRFLRFSAYSFSLEGGDEG